MKHSAYSLLYFHDIMMPMKGSQIVKISFLWVGIRHSRRKSLLKIDPHVFSWRDATITHHPTLMTFNNHTRSTIGDAIYELNFIRGTYYVRYRYIFVFRIFLLKYISPCVLDAIPFAEHILYVRQKILQYLLRKR